MKTLTDFRDTWAFLNGRVRDAFDFKKSIQEVLCTFKVARELWWTIVDRVSEFFDDFAGTILGRSNWCRHGKLRTRFHELSFQKMKLQG